MALAGKVVLITGATSGIGAATAVYFSKLGALLSLTGRKAKDLDEVLGQCEPKNTFIVPGELTDDADVKNIVECTIKHYCKLDVLVNNAGILESGGIENTCVEQYDRIFNVNVRAVYYMTALAVPHIVKTKGNIINVSSIAGLGSYSGVLSYCMSKSTINQFTRCAALELAEKQVRVNAVNPGVIRTNIHTATGMSEEELRATFDHSDEGEGLREVGNATEVAKAIAYLASDTAGYISGVTLPVDGGRHAKCPR